MTQSSNIMIGQLCEPLGTINTLVREINHIIDENESNDAINISVNDTKISCKVNLVKSSKCKHVEISLNIEGYGKYTLYVAQHHKKNVYQLLIPDGITIEEEKCRKNHQFYTSDIIKTVGKWESRPCSFGSCPYGRSSISMCGCKCPDVTEHDIELISLFNGYLREFGINEPHIEVKGNNNKNYTDAGGQFVVRPHYARMDDCFARRIEVEIVNKDKLLKLIRIIKQIAEHVKKEINMDDPTEESYDLKQVISYDTLILFQKYNNQSNKVIRSDISGTQKDIVLTNIQTQHKRKFNELTQELEI